MRAVILAGGKGTRLKPYTVVLPKPLMPIGDYPILEVVVRQLAKSGFTHITMAVNHQAELIQTFFGDGSKWNVKIDYSVEDKPLSTMGPLKLIKDLPENFLIMNGDILTDLNYKEFYDNHVKNNNIFTISSCTRSQVCDYGVLDVDDKGVLSQIREKPSFDYKVSMGIYIASNSILDYIPENTSYGFDILMEDLLKDKKSVTVNDFKGYWLDIGRPDDYMQAIDEFDSQKSTFLKE